MRVQPKKNERAASWAQEKTVEGIHSAGSGKEAQPADAGQSFSDGETGHGKTGSGSPPVPFEAPVNRRPPYPEIARQRGQQGQVVLLVLVDMHGNPTEVLIETSSGHPLLDRSALAAIQRWKFAPARHNGDPVPGKVRVPVAFRLQ